MAYGSGPRASPGSGPDRAALHAEIPRRVAGGSAVEIAACGRDGRMAQGLPHEVDRRAPAETMAGVRVSQPMSRQVGPKPGPLVRSLHHPLRRAWVERASRGSPGARLAAG